MKNVCQNEFCRKTIEFELPPPDLINSRYITFLVWPKVLVICPDCQQQHGVEFVEVKHTETIKLVQEGAPGTPSFRPPLTKN